MNHISRFSRVALIVIVTPGTDTADVAGAGDLMRRPGIRRATEGSTGVLLVGLGRATMGRLAVKT